MNQQPAISNQQSVMTLERAQLYLASRVRVRTPLGAGEYLDCVRHHARENYDKRLSIALDCLSIYRQLFPEQYTRSTSSLFSMQREHEFYRLVHTQCFPLVVDNDADLLTYLEREPRFCLPFIPVRGLQRYEWINGGYNFEELETPYQLALLLSTMLPDDAREATIAGLCFPADFPLPAPPLGRLGWSLFEHACKVDQTPIQYLPLAFHLISYKTGNMWLDLPRQVGYLGHAWSMEKVAALTLMRLEADKFDIAMRTLHNWFAEDRPGRIAHAVNLWNQASQKEFDFGFEGLTGDECMAAGIEAGWLPIADGVMGMPPGELERMWQGNYDGRQLN